METFYYSMTSSGPWLLDASDGESAQREVYSDYFLRRETKYIYSMTKEVLAERPEDGWNAEEFQMALPL